MRDVGDTICDVAGLGPLGFGLSFSASTMTGGSGRLEVHSVVQVVKPMG